jgi:hypothetical protein
VIYRKLTLQTSKSLKCKYEQTFEMHKCTIYIYIKLIRGTTVAIMNAVRSGILEGAYIHNDSLYCIHNRNCRSAFKFYVCIFFLISVF